MAAVPISWPQYLVTVATALPLAGAWSARRLSWRDPVGQVGIAWGVLFALSAVQIVGVLTGHLIYLAWSRAAVAILAPLLLVPPLLTWMGPGATRWRTPLLVFLALAGVAALLAFGIRGRGITLVYRTPGALLLATLSLGMLVAQARRAGDPQGVPPEPGWLWIGGGHLVYHLTQVIGRTFVEFLFLVVGRSGTRDANMGILLVYSATLAVIAWGQWKGRRVAAPPTAARVAA